MFSKIKMSTPQNEIGEVVPVLTGGNNNPTITTSQSKFIKTDGIYNQADYPELYSKIGLVGASQFTPRNSGTTSQINAICYGNGRYVFGGVGGVIGSSTDGINWTLRSSGTGFQIFGVAYGAGTYVYIGEVNALGTSTDGATWTVRTTPVGSAYGLHYANGLFLTSGLSEFLTSTNGINWTTYFYQVPVDGSSGRRPISYGNGLYMVGSSTGSAGYIASSSDLVNWYSAYVDVPVYDILYHNGQFVISTADRFTSFDTILTTTDGRNFVYRTSPGLLGSITSLEYGNGLYIASSGNGISYTSTDLSNWNLISHGSNTKWSSVYNNGLFVAVGSGGLLATSTTAINFEHSPFYDISTQFYVPSFSTGTRYYTLPSYTPNTSVTTVNYIRAK